MSSIEFFVLLGAVLYVNSILLVVSFLSTRVFNWLFVQQLAWLKNKLQFSVALAFFAAMYLVLTTTQWNAGVAYFRTQVLISIVPILVLFFGFIAFRIYFQKHQGMWSAKV